MPGGKQSRMSVFGAACFFYWESFIFMEKVKPEQSVQRKCGMHYMYSISYVLEVLKILEFSDIKV